eukprot:TRINITY_DN3572_c0_g1_i1.p1 TRINITY_DN3572_c0_g1~~TRINITY_DN3572_c0_g1_i1.p1  ORF type:complete len:503 (-),score=103.17 TRINITY_DN3572_c0_g1_i1:482-1990(-)
MMGLMSQSRFLCQRLSSSLRRVPSTAFRHSSAHEDDWKSDILSPQMKEDPKTPQEIQSFRESNRITVEGVDTNPVFSFQEPGFPIGIVEKLRQNGFDKPTPIQSQGWPIAMNGDSVIAIGETGSGKTLGFVLPAVCHVLRQPKRKNRSEGPLVLILAPTRELAQQTNQVVKSFASRIPSACLVGGTHKHVQIRDLDRGAEIVVATPGRLIDLVEDEVTDLDRVSYVVLDEADRMLDMGFEPQIRKIMRRIPSERQLLMWSATWPTEVKSLAHDLFGNSPYAHVNIGSTELQANKLIEQKFEFCSRMDKSNRLKDILDSLSETEREKVLIFAATKSRVDSLVRKLRFWHINANGIHGDKTQAIRTRVLNDFRSGQIEALVATDVASRGLDVNDIQVVINYDFPNDIEDYVHRIGRTGRNSKSGRAFSFFDMSNDGSKAKSLVKVLKEAEQDVPDELLRAQPSQMNKRSKYQRRQHASFDDDFYNSPWRKNNYKRDRRYSEDIL